MKSIRPQKQFVSHWLSANLHEMIDCPFQPGNLKILKKACLRRLEASIKWDFHNLFQNEHFIYSVKQGLQICNSCPIVEKVRDVRVAAKRERLKSVQGLLDQTSSLPVRT